VESAAGAAIPIHLTLYQALIKGPKWDWLLEKACEIGVSKVVPVVTRRTVVKVANGEKGEKQARWNRIALAASKQCARADILELGLPTPLPVALSQLPPGDLALIPWEKEDAKSIPQACQGYPGKAAAVFVGPEGGWESAEVDLATHHQVIPVRLGPTLLRSETAGLVAATLILRELGVYA
jgi:16S rRNA (uracil1498-N3)-methyltransferase